MKPPPAVNDGHQTGLEPLVNAIADAVAARILAKQSTKRLFSVDEAAEYMGRTPHAVRNLISRKALPNVRQDGRVFLDREDLDRLIEAHKTLGR